jgi:hypothetical protein
MNQLNQLLKEIAFLQDAVLQDALLAAGLIAAMVLVLSARREFRRETRQREKALAALTAKVAALPRGVKQQAPPAPAAAVAAGNPEANANAANPGITTTAAASAVVPAVRSGVNLNWRVQALRLLRRGQDVAHVSTALGVSRREIELLIRVHQLASGRAPSRFV